jgi:cell fate regulator YaaT (PSP1 superfamily)
MKVAEVQFVSWDKIYYFLLNDLDIKKGAKVVVKTELGTELGELVGFAEVNDKEFVAEGEENGDDRRVIKPILRVASEDDLSREVPLEEKEEAVNYCREMKEKHDLPMKVIDAHFSYDGSRITFAFIADGRVDFRELVKDLTRHFGKTIRLQQIGIRDEARIMGDYGHCGKRLCCKGHLRNLESITSEMAELQQCSHRGSDRISGICGRLMCCLAYEQEGYEENAKKMPPIGTRVNVDGKRGVVVGHHILKEAVDVEFGGEKGSEKVVMEVSLNRNKKKEEEKK